MKQHSIDLPNEFQPVTEETFFDEETVQRIPAVMPLDETPTRTSSRFRKMRVPMRKQDNSFNPAFLIMALVAVTALGVIAGTLLYRTAAEKSANNAAMENGEPVNRTVPAQYQFVLDKPESGETKDSFSKDNPTSLPSTSASTKKDSRDKDESSAPEANNEQQENAQNEEVVEEKEATAPSEEDEDIPPPPPLRRDRKEDKKQDKAKQKDKNDKPEVKEEEPPVEESEN
jgi:hypothetical protein